MAGGVKRRMVEKDGYINVENSLKNHHFFKDPVGTVARWNFCEHLVVLLILCLVPWILFALIWHFTFWLHGDLEPENLPDKQEETGWTPCVFAIHDFVSSLLFSLETQRSIGYGLRGTSHKCPDSVMLEIIQSICAILIECVIGVILYIKLQRGLTYSKIIKFSHNAVVSLRNGKLRLMFRMMNIKSEKIPARLSGYVVHQVTTVEGEVIDYHFSKIQFSSQVDDDEKNPCNLATPVLPDIVSHTIDSTSPLYNMSPDNITAMKIEVIVSVVLIEPDGSQSRFMTSYLPDEIIWGCHFSNCVVFREEENMFLVDVDRINKIVPNATTPWMSAKKMIEC